jgi:excinuclease ABC subunit C
VNKQLQEKLKTLPRDPGVYFHKSKSGEIIYVGKAAVLKNREKQYFQKSRPFDPKTEALVAEIYDTDWITVETELDALFLESEMIKRYKPRYNILLRDDKSQTYIRIQMKDMYPAVAFTRGPLDDGADYFGPYYNGWAIKKALKYLRRIFPYSTHETMPTRVCLQYHLGLCPGVEEAKISEKDYKANLRRLEMYLRGSRKQLVVDLEKEMKQLAKQSEFEQAAVLRNQINDLKSLQRQIIFSDKEFMDLSKDQALAGLQRLLTLADVPRRIEGYDISHMQGTNNVASMVVATNGLADKAQYRKFKMNIPGNNDFAHMNETMLRRFSGRHKDWPLPSLIIIDGGKGQLSAALDALEEQGVHIPVVGLAKREEEIVVHKTRSNVQVNTAAIQAWVKEKNPFSEPDVRVDPARSLESKYVAERVREDQQPGISGDSEDFLVIRLPKNNHIIKLLQRIRDESHRFAVSYHTYLKRTGQVKSVLDDIPGVGPITRKKLLKAFGSVDGIKAASVADLGRHVGLIKAKVIKTYLS